MLICISLLVDWLLNWEDISTYSFALRPLIDWFLNQKILIQILPFLDWLFDWFIDWLIDWWNTLFIGWSDRLLIDGSIDWLIDLKAYRQYTTLMFQGFFQLFIFFFFFSIDPLKRMTSTPLVLGITEDQAYKERMRNKPRASYLAPAGASKLPLSPITEGSRENKSTTPSSSGVSTWIRSKKSLANYSPVDEHDEAGGDKSTGGNKSSHWTGHSGVFFFTKSN